MDMTPLYPIMVVRINVLNIARTEKLSRADPGEPRRGTAVHWAVMLQDLTGGNHVRRSQGLRAVCHSGRAPDLVRKPVQPQIRRFRRVVELLHQTRPAIAE